MPLPKGLRYHDRIAKVNDRCWLFLCKRKGHRKLVRRFKFESDAKDFRAAHDTGFHNATFRHLGFNPNDHVRIRHLLAEWKAHVGQLEVEGVRSPATSRHYELVCDRLEKACRAAGIRTTRDITPQRLSEVVRWFRRNTGSGGALTAKSLSALKTMCRWKAIRADWQIPHDEIRAEPHEKLDFDAETIRRVVAAMPEGSLEEAVAYLKARTGAHDVEIYQAKKEEFDLGVSVARNGESVKVGIFRPVLRKKGGRTTNRRRKRHVYVITSDAVERIRPFVERAKPGGFVFVGEDWRPVNREKMRARIRAASKQAGIVKVKLDKPRREGEEARKISIGAIDSLAQIRAEVITVVTEEISLREAAAHSGHNDPATTDQWYVKDRVTLRKIVEKLRPAEIIARAIPLRSEGGTEGGTERAGNSCADMETELDGQAGVETRKPLISQGLRGVSSGAVDRT